MQVNLIALAFLAVTATPAAAQLTAEQARAKADKVAVVVLVPDGTWRGQLLDIDAETVTILPKGGSPTTLKLANVLRIESKKWDSPADGAIVGGLAMVVWCVIICAQGASSENTAGKIILTGGMLGMVLGGAIDAAHRSNRVIYKRPNATPARRSPGVFFTVRF